MKFIDFFAGIGGFRRGLELSGHECVGFCEWDKFATASYTSMHLITEEQRKKLSEFTIKNRQKEILKDEYRNGEWYSNDIRTVDAGSLPDADCWCFGAPCQDFSIAGKRAGLDGDRSSLIREIFRLLEEQKEQDRPEWLMYENVKGMLSSNRGLDYLSILSEMDRLGYDIEWQNINSKWWVPQNRERIYTVGHLRRCGRTKIFPVTGTDGQNNISVIQKNESIVSFCSIYKSCGIEEKKISDTIISRYNKGISKRKNECSGVLVKTICNTNPSGRGMNGNVYDSIGLNPTLTTNKGEGNKIAIPVIDITHLDKNQNGRRFKENGEPMFTLTAQDRHGVAIGVIDRQGRISKKVKPKDLCPTLRSETHGNVPEICVNTGVNISGYQIKNLSDTSGCLNANDQRKVFGANQERTMVAVKYDPELIGGIGEINFGKQFRQGNRIYSSESPSMALTAQPVGNNGGNSYLYSVRTKENKKQNDGIYVEMPGGFLSYCVWYEKYNCYIAIRRLTPKECFRLQGWTDDYFQKAAFVNSDSQLYKQAGNGVTVDVVKAIGEKINAGR